MLWLPLQLERRFVDSFTTVTQRKTSSQPTSSAVSKGLTDSLNEILKNVHRFVGGRTCTVSLRCIQISSEIHRRRYLQQRCPVVGHHFGCFQGDTGLGDAPNPPATKRTSIRYLHSTSLPPLLLRTPNRACEAPSETDQTRTGKHHLR